MTYSIAIDGPAGAGKSTIAKLLAEKLDFIYVDTGAMFRGIAVAVIRAGIDPEDEETVTKLCREVDIRVEYKDGNMIINIDGCDITGSLRDEETGKISSVIAVYGSVRDKLLALQRDIAEKYNVVMDGRDIGSVVLPNATIKIYLSASAVARGMRRYRELEEKGIESNLTQIISDIRERDYRDMNREIAPLSVAEGAHAIDSSDMTVDEVMAECLKLVGENKALSEVYHGGV